VGEPWAREHARALGLSLRVRVVTSGKTPFPPWLFLAAVLADAASVV
jgi:hypothetical protein